MDGGSLLMPTPSLDRNSRSSKRYLVGDSSYLFFVSPPSVLHHCHLFSLESSNPSLLWHLWSLPCNYTLFILLALLRPSLSNTDVAPGWRTCPRPLARCWRLVNASPGSPAHSGACGGCCVSESEHTLPWVCGQRLLPYSTLRLIFLSSFSPLCDANKNYTYLGGLRGGLSTAVHAKDVGST